MDSKVIRQIIENFTKTGHIEYRFTKDQVNILKDKKTVAIIKGDNLYFLNPKRNVIEENLPTPRLAILPQLAKNYKQT